MNQLISLLVGYVPKITEVQKNQLHNKLGTRPVTRFNEINVDVVEVIKNDLNHIMNHFLSSEHVAFIEENDILSPCKLPDDQFYQQFSNHSNHPHGEWGFARVNFEDAWNAARHIKQKVTIAILDTGIDPKHPAFSSKIVKPVNFTSKDKNDYIDEHGHGTHVAGIAASVTNSKAYSTYTTKIMPIKVIGPKGGQSKWIISGILHAVINGAKVINISIGGPPFSKALQRAINYAWQKGVVIVAAAGNEGMEKVEYPAGYNFVLAVSAANEANNRAKFSNWGVNIGISAPGTSILSTTPTYPTPNKLPFYDTLQGTSQATPFISGLAALLFAIDQNLSNEDVIQTIQKSADPINEEIKQWNPFFGYGLLNPTNAINRTMGKPLGKSIGKKSSEFQECKGSFYGQLVNESDNPIGNALVSARKNGEILSQYKTNHNIPTETGNLVSDGMFRLKNLPPGKYSIFVEISGQAPIHMGIFTVKEGADTILQLVCEER